MQKLGKFFLYLFSVFGILALVVVCAVVGTIEYNSLTNPAATNPDASAVTQTRFYAAIRAQTQLRNMSNGRTKVEQYFDGPDGMIGIVGLDSKTHKRFIAWASAKGNTVVLGPVLSQGKNLTAYYEKKILGKPGNPVTRNGTGAVTGATSPHPHAAATAPRKKLSSADILKDANRAIGLTLGDSDKHLYMFHDPFCSFCVQAKRALLGPIDAGTVKVSFIPVGALGLESQQAAAALIAKNNRASLMRPGSELKDLSYSAEDVSEVKKNTTLLAALAPRVATPTFVFVDKKTGKAQVKQGLPQDMNTMIGQIKPVKE